MIENNKKESILWYENTYFNFNIHKVYSYKYIYMHKYKLINFY